MAAPHKVYPHVPKRVLFLHVLFGLWLGMLLHPRSDALAPLVLPLVSLLVLTRRRGVAAAFSAVVFLGVFTALGLARLPLRSYLTHVGSVLWATFFSSPGLGEVFFLFLVNALPFPRPIQDTLFAARYFLAKTRRDVLPAMRLQRNLEGLTAREMMGYAWKNGRQVVQETLVSLPLLSEEARFDDVNRLRGALVLGLLAGLTAMSLSPF